MTAKALVSSLIEDEDDEPLDKSFVADPYIGKWYSTMETGNYFMPFHRLNPNTRYGSGFYTMMALRPGGSYRGVLIFRDDDGKQYSEISAFTVDQVMRDFKPCTPKFVDDALDLSRRVRDAGPAGDDRSDPSDVGDDFDWTPNQH